VSVSDRMIRTKREAISAVLDQLIRAGAVENHCREEILREIMNREELGSTAIGRGYAVPHGKHPDLREVVCAVATLPVPIEFDSLDREPVHTIYVIISPSDKPGDHLRIIEAISRRLRYQ